MKQIELIALLLKYKTNLKYLKKQLSPTFWVYLNKPLTITMLKGQIFI